LSSLTSAATGSTATMSMCGRSAAVLLMSALLSDVRSCQIA
jgi:hypothetical protein